MSENHLSLSLSFSLSPRCTYYIYGLYTVTISCSMEFIRQLAHPCIPTIAAAQ